MTTSVSDTQDKVNQADILLSMGMRPGIVRLQTSLTETKVRQRSKRLRDMNPGMGTGQGRWKKTTNLISKCDPHMEAVSFLLLYLHYTNEPHKTIENEGFVKAFTHYCTALEVDPTCPDDLALGINQCWVLARDYREGSIAILECSRCEGGKLLRYQSIKVNSRCPICGKDGQPEELRKRKSRAKKHTPPIEVPPVPPLQITKPE